MEKLTLEKLIEQAREIVERNNQIIAFTSIDSVDDEIKVNCRKNIEQFNQIAQWLEELKSYKDAEEQGLLLRLPVPIGTIVYCIYTSMTGKNVTILADRFTVDMCKSWGAFVFATKEKAEKKLEEMKNDGSKK